MNYRTNELSMIRYKQKKKKKHRTLELTQNGTSR